MTEPGILPKIENNCVERQDCFTCCFYSIFYENRVDIEL